LASRLNGLSTSRTEAIRSQFISVGTCSITEPLEDLVNLGLVTRHRGTHELA